MTDEVQPVLLPALAAFVVAGVDGAVYDGSLNEWTAAEDLPVEVG